ncbi:MAG: arsenic transporter [Lachnospiraceae bacterium]|nr:arsenic transporter [Lachnospiraceae bacterium]
MIIALVIFCAMYIGMLALPKFRVWFAIGGAILMVICGVIPFYEIPAAINWNVIMMIAGTMGIVTLFIESKMPMRLADQMLNVMPNVCWVIIALSVFSGVISAFVDNVATVLMVAPVAMAICKKLNIKPIPVIISVAVSSNLQGAATLVGDTTSILLGGYAGMSFVDFIWWQGRPSIFWAVELGALGTVAILWLIFRKEKKKIEKITPTEVNDFVPGLFLVFTVVLLIIASFFDIPYIDDYKNGMICITLCFIDVVRSGIKKKSASPLKLVIKELDLTTLGMLCGLFIVIKGITEAGIITAIADWFASIGNGSMYALYTIIVFASVILSAFIDNIPYVAAMLPVVEGIAIKLGTDPIVLYFGLLSGATLGGNITPFGASANVTGIGILKKEGYEVKNSDFFKIGVPFTLTAVLIGYVVIWLTWGI